MLIAACGLVTLLSLLNEARTGRAEAETNRQIASDALGDTVNLMGLIAAGVAKPDDDRVLKELSRLRLRQQKLYYARMSDRLAGMQLVRLNIALADQLIPSRSLAEAQPIVEECLCILERASADSRPGAEETLEEIRCRSRLSDIFWHQKRFAEALRHSGHACYILDAIDAKLVPDEWLHFAVRCHVQTGQLLSFNLDRADYARQWLKDRKRWLDALTAHEANNPSHLSLHARWLLAAGNNEEALAFLRAAVRSHPKNVDLATMIAEQLIPPADRIPSDEKRRALLDEASVALTSVAEVAELTAVTDPGNIDALYTFGHLHHKLCYCLVQLGERDEAVAVSQRLVSVVKSLQTRHAANPGAASDFWREMAKTMAMMRPILHTEQAPADFIRTSLQEMGFHAHSEGELGWCVTLAEGDLAAQMRRLEQRADAKQQVAHMVNYANELVARYPGDLFAHLALSKAQIHVFKNALRYKDGNPQTALRTATQFGRASTGHRPRKRQVPSRGRRLSTAARANQTVVLTSLFSL